MKVEYWLTAFIVLIAAAIVSPVEASTSLSCPGTLSGVTEGSTVTLTASPGPTGYDYLWTVHSPLTTVSSSLTGNQVVIKIPGCDATPQPWTVDLYMKPTGAPSACSYTCTITITCTSCTCPTITEGCVKKDTGLAGTPWSYSCPTQSPLLVNEWWIQTNLATPPVEGTPATWGTKVQSTVGTSSSYTPVAPYLPTSSNPKLQYYVTFVVRQDNSGIGKPDVIVKFCQQTGLESTIAGLVTLYYDPTATMTSVIS
jgi:hypothetical protein